MNKLSLLCIVFIMLIVSLDEIFAIPAFARKYNMSCNVCHAPAPRLKQYGDDFAGNGFQIADKEPLRYFQETGDDKLLLMRDFPIAMRFDLYGQYQSKGSEGPDLKTPWVLKVLSGGQVAKDVAYYFYFFFSERGEVAGIEDAYIMFNNIGNIDLDLYIGQFQVSDPLFKSELRLPFEGYQIYSTRVGNSLAGLKYDRGLMLTYSAPTNTNFALEIINGNGIEQHGYIFDNDNYKNYFLRASQEILPEFRLGAFAYYGKEQRGKFSDEIIMVGPDFTLTSEPIEFNFQYVYRKDNNPYFLNSTLASNVNTRGAFAEIIYSPEGDKSDWYTTMLYNRVNSDLKGIDYESLSINGTYLLARNLRLIGEYTYDMKAEISKLTFGIFAAF